MKKYKSENKDKIKKHNQKYRIKNRDKIIKYNERYKERKKKYDKEYRRENEDRINKYRIENKDRLNKNRRDNNDKRKKYTNIPHINLSIKLRNRVNKALKIYTKEGKIKSSGEYNIDYEKIIERLKPFPKNQSRYHIDHIRPLCSFNFINKDGTQNLEEIKKAFTPENHQWLLIEDNLSKGGNWGTKEQVKYLFI